MSRREHPWTIEELSNVSLALKCYREQAGRFPEARDQSEIGRLTGDESGPEVFDLTSIWEAAQADAGNLKTASQKRYLSPRRFGNRWSHLVEHYHVANGRVMSDAESAFNYCQFIDDRVMGTCIHWMIENGKAAAHLDPIGNAVKATAGGPFAMIFAFADARHLGLTVPEFSDAVMARAKVDAASMDDYSAEKLVAQVRRTLDEFTAKHVPDDSVSYQKRGA